MGECCSLFWNRRGFICLNDAFPYYLLLFSICYLCVAEGRRRSPQQWLRLIMMCCLAKDLLRRSTTIHCPYSWSLFCLACAYYSFTRCSNSSFIMYQKVWLSFSLVSVQVWSFDVWWEIDSNSSYTLTFRSNCWSVFEVNVLPEDCQLDKGRSILSYSFFPGPAASNHFWIRLQPTQSKVIVDWPALKVNL